MKKYKDIKITNKVIMSTTNLCMETLVVDILLLNNLLYYIFYYIIFYTIRFLLPLKI